jgi:hypothetical protein
MHCHRTNELHSRTWVKRGPQVRRSVIGRCAAPRGRAFLSSIPMAGPAWPDPLPAWRSVPGVRQAAIPAAAHQARGADRRRTRRLPRGNPRTWRLAHQLPRGCAPTGRWCESASPLHPSPLRRLERSGSRGHLRFRTNSCRWSGGDCGMIRWTASGGTLSPADRLVAPGSRWRSCGTGACCLSVRSLASRGSVADSGFEADRLRADRRPRGGCLDPGPWSLGHREGTGQLNAAGWPSMHHGTWRALARCVAGSSAHARRSDSNQAFHERTPGNAPTFGRGNSRPHQASA